MTAGKNFVESFGESHIDMKICDIVCGDFLLGLTLSHQSSVIGVGVGLFLGLTVLQVVGSGGMAALRRKSSSLRDTVNANRLDKQRSKVGRVDAELLKLEIELTSLSKTLFCLASVLLIVSLAGLVYSSIHPTAPLTCHLLWSIIGFYLVLPLLVFLVSAIVINRKSRSANMAVADCEREIYSALSDKS